MAISSSIALVTGGSRGRGKSAAVTLADYGVDVVLTYRTKRAEAEAVVAQIQQRGCRAVALPLDVALVSSLGAFAERLGAVP